MILVDTSVWVDHLRRGSRDLAAILELGEVLCHPFVVGELACGSLARRLEVLALLSALPQAVVVTHDEAIGFVGQHRLWGSGLGWVDVHLLAAAALNRSSLWTLDRRLASAAKQMELAWRPQAPAERNALT